MKKITLALCCLLIVLASCGPKDPITPEDVTIGKGVFVINEGNFGYANSTLTFYNPTTDTVANNLFRRANWPSIIGDTGESLVLLDGKLYIVVNGSRYIYKADAQTIVVDTTKPYKLTNFVSPRYMLPVASNKAYVSDIADTSLYIINPESMTHIGTIAMGKSTETMVRIGQEIFVANWSRGYFPTMANNTVQVVDIVSDTKVAEIQVGCEPNCMVLDKDGMLWVLCEGDNYDLTADVPCTLWKINPTTRESTLVRTFDKPAFNLAIDPTGNYLYCIYGGDWNNGGDLRRINIANPTVFDDLTIPAEGRQFYKIAVDPSNGDIYLSDAKRYTTNGTVYRYSSKGELLSSFNAGISPGFMLFN